MTSQPAPRHAPRLQSRRSFLRDGGRTACFGYFLNLASYNIFAAPNPIERIAVSSSMFRNRFKDTPNASTASAPRLDLESFPEFITKRFGIHRLEYWSPHFKSLSRPYLTTLNQRLDDAHCQLVNLQVDASYQLASPNEKVRQESVKTVKAWIDAARFMNVPSVRANPGKGILEAAIRSFRELVAYSKTNRVRLLTENHFGMETDPKIHLAIHHAVKDPEFKLIADFGNYHRNPDRYEALEKIMPLAHLVSAKVMDLDEGFNHTTFDFDRCMRIALAVGFNGLFSIEQWSKEPVPHPEEQVVDWAIQRIKHHLSASKSEPIKN